MDPFEGMNEVPSQWIKFSKIGDYVKGTLTDVREMESRIPGKEGTKTRVYELQVDSGQFHTSENKLDANGNKITIVSETPYVMTKGEFWLVGGKESIDNQMRNVRKGQIVGFRLSEIKPSKTPGFAAQKVIKVLVGGMDPEYMGQSAGDASVQ